MRDAPRLDQVTHRIARRAPRATPPAFRRTTSRATIRQRSSISAMPSGRTAISPWPTCSLRSRCRRSAVGTIAPRPTQHSPTAFRLRDRLPERERYDVEGAYYYSAGRASQGHSGATSRSGARLHQHRRCQHARERAQRHARRRAAPSKCSSSRSRAIRTTARSLSNLGVLYTVMGRHAAFDSVLTMMASRSASFTTAPIRFEEMWNRRDYDGAEKLARAQADTASRSRLWARRMRWSGSRCCVAGCTKLSVASRRRAKRGFAYAATPRIRTWPRSSTRWWTASSAATCRARSRGSMLSSRANPPASVPVSRDQSMWLAYAYARLGATAKAREVMRQHEARLDTLGKRQDAVFLARTRGTIALAEGKVDSAIAYFRRGDVEADGLPTNACSVCTPLFIGLAFDRGGQADSARTYLRNTWK